MLSRAFKEKCTRISEIKFQQSVYMLELSFDFIEDMVISG